MFNIKVMAGNFNHDVKTKSGLTSIYNEKVVHVEQMERPMSSSDGRKNIPFVNHQGVRYVSSFNPFGHNVEKWPNMREKG